MSAPSCKGCANWRPPVVGDLGTCAVVRAAVPSLKPGQKLNLRICTLADDGCAQNFAPILERANV